MTRQFCPQNRRVTLTLTRPTAKRSIALLQPLDQFPLRRDGPIEVLNRLVLMNGAHFKLVEAGGGGGCVWHAGGISAGNGGRQWGMSRDRNSILFYPAGMMSFRGIGRSRPIN
jgi:hypothetical protein